MRQTLLFTGHLLDLIDRISSRFPYLQINEVKRMIADEIKSFRLSDEQQIAISSLTAGSDILFAEAVLEAGGGAADFAHEMTSAGIQGDDYGLIVLIGFSIVSNEPVKI